MKKTTSTILLLSFLAFQATAQQVEAVQRSLITKRTATWCPNCGSWGWTFFTNLIADNQDKAVFFAAHFGSSLLGNTVGEELTDNFGAAYQPVFYLDEVNQSALPSNVATLRNTIKDKVDDAFATAPIANSAFKPTYQNGQIKVDAHVKFFQATEGEFYLGIYLVEDNVIEYQASIGNNASHKEVLQASFSSSTWGEQLANGSVAAETTFAKSFALEADDPAAHDYEVVGVIWKKVGDKYEVVNVWSTDEFGTVSQAGEMLAGIGFSMSPTLVSEQATVRLELQNALENLSLEVVDANGRLVSTLHRGKLAAGQHSFLVEKAKLGVAGTYLIKVSDGKKTGARRFVLN